MKFKISISPGIGIFVLGFAGLVLSLAQDPGKIGGKVPLALFFMFIIIIGMVIEMKIKDNSFETFGEMESDGKFR